MRSFQNGVRAFTRAFPPPQFLASPLAGVDISDASVKHIVLSGSPGAYEVKSFGTAILPKGAVVNGRVESPEALAENLSILRKEHAIDAGHFALPEEHAYLFQMPFPETEEANIEETIEFNLKENVPLSPSEVVFSYLVGRGREGKPFLAVSAYPRAVINTYLEAAHSAGITVLSFETEGHAIARASLGGDTFQKTMLMLDLGWNTTGLSIVREGVILFSTQLETTGKTFCRAIEEVTGKSEDDAYALMKKEGLRKSGGQDVVSSAIRGTLETLQGEMKKHLAYWDMHAEGNVSHERVFGIVVAGSTTAVPGFVEHLATLLPIPILGANVWQNVCTFDRFVPPISKDDSYAFATAIGLALRSRFVW